RSPPGAGRRAVALRPLTSRGEEGEQRNFRIEAGWESAQRLQEVGDEVFRVLEPDGEADQVLRRPGVKPFARGAMLDQALDAAERGGAGEQPRPPDRGEGRLPAAG